MPLPDLRPAAILVPSFRLYVLAVDGLSRGLLQAEGRQAHYERIRDRLFPNLLFRVETQDVDELHHDGSELWLTPEASERWLARAGRQRHNVDFGFLYSPFAVVLGDRCLSGGWVVPRSSQSPFPYPRLYASFGVRRLALRLVAGKPVADMPIDDPALALLAARAASA
jgi:hypothetical protein